ncbi:MAG: efflux RND transporter permease subunit, partial [candidate division KSB1 bacterium]|nr:efflux RND transporter permease subunit [candidate division KSB1 bacterium]
MSIAKFSVRNSVLVNLLMIGLFIFGGISLLRMPMELNPNIDFNWVFITVVYPGAAPSETESLIVDPIEAEIQDIEDIEEIQSTAGEGFGFLLVKFEEMSSSEFREHFSDLKSEIDKVELPDDAEDPVIDDFGSDDFVPVININMSYTIPKDNAQKIADELEDDLKDINGVSKVQVSGLAEREIWIEVDPVKMNAFGVTFDEIVVALKLRNLNVPGGNITFGKTEYLIRSLGEYQSIGEIENTIVRQANGMGKSDAIKVSDIAKVNDTREEMFILSRLNGDPSITFSASKRSEANSMDVIEEIKEVVKAYEEIVPDGVDFSWTQDNSVYIQRVIDTLRNNAIFGMLLIVLLLFIFLGGRNAFLASLGIPISFFITFILMYAFGYSLNGSTLFALVMVLGIIVDDAIIVIENCHRYRLMGYNSRESAIHGTTEVVKPILSAIGTNIAAFLPLILLPGIMGRFLRIIPIVFSLALIASLFEAFFLLPSHYSDWTAGSRVYKRGEKKFFKLLRRYYTRVLMKVLRYRYIVLGAMVLILLGSFSVIGLVGVEMFGEEDFDQFTILVKMPEGTSLQESDRIMKKIEAETRKLPQSEVQDVIVNVGLLQGNEEWLTKKNVAQVLFQLKPQEEREFSIDELMDRMRERLKFVSGPISVELEKVSGGPPVGKPISIKIEGKYLEEIKQASLALQDTIRSLEGTMDVADNFPPGKQEIRIVVDDEKAALFGFSTQFVAMNVRYAFDGIKATEYRDGDEEVDVIVKYDETNRSSVDDVLNLKLSNPAGQTVALGDMVSFEIEPGPTEINRYDQKRTIL